MCAEVVFYCFPCRQLPAEWNPNGFLPVRKDTLRHVEYREVLDWASQQSRANLENNKYVSSTDWFADSELFIEIIKHLHVCLIPINVFISGCRRERPHKIQELINIVRDRLDGWLHLRWINKLCLALRPASIHHIQHSDHYTSNGRKHWLSGFLKLDYIHCSTDINGRHFVMRCLHVCLIKGYSVVFNLSFNLASCNTKQFVSGLTWSNEQSVLERSRVARLLGWPRNW